MRDISEGVRNVFSIGWGRILGFAEKYAAAISVAIVIALLLLAAWITTPNTPSAQTEILDGPKRAEFSYTAGYDSENGLYVRVERPLPSQSASGISAEDSKEPSKQRLGTAEADLLAQERVAHWTFWIAVFTAIGLVAIVATFEAARQQTIATREIGEMQSRCYVNVSSCIFSLDLPERPANESEVSDQNNRITDAYPKISVRIENAGQTPARAIKWRPKFLMYSAIICTGEQTISFDSKSRELDVSPPFEGSWGRFLKAGDDFEDDAGTYAVHPRVIDVAALIGPSPSVLVISLVISVGVLDAFGRVERLEFGFRGALRDGNTGPINLSPVPASHIVGPNESLSRGKT